MKKTYLVAMMTCVMFLFGAKHVHSFQPDYPQNFAWAPKYRTVTNPDTGDPVDLERTYMDTQVAYYRVKPGTPPPNNDICSASPDICVLYNSGF